MSSLRQHHTGQISPSMLSVFAGEAGSTASLASHSWTIVLTPCLSSNLRAASLQSLYFLFIIQNIDAFILDCIYLFTFFFTFDCIMGQGRCDESFAPGSNLYKLCNSVSTDHGLVGMVSHSEAEVARR